MPDLDTPLSGEMKRNILLSELSVRLALLVVFLLVEKWLLVACIILFFYVEVLVILSYPSACVCV